MAQTEYQPVPEMVYDQPSHLNATKVVRWSGINMKAPVPLIQRRDVMVGDTIVSSHSGVVLVVRKRWMPINPDFSVTLWGDGWFAEVYESRSSVPLLKRGGIDFVKDQDALVPKPIRERFEIGLIEDITLLPSAVKAAKA